MAEIAVFPITDVSLPQGLFSAGAEGTLSWFRTIGATTLDPREQAVAVVLIRDGSVQAALPLARSEAGARALTAPYTTLYAPALLHPADAETLGRAARSYASGVLRLDAVDASHSGMSAFLDGLAVSGLAIAQYEGFANWHEAVTDFDSYWQARPSRLRTTVRRKLAAATKAGLEFTLFRDDLERALAIYEEIYRSSWKSPEPHVGFMPQMVRALGREGLIRIGVMAIGERAVAAQIWLVAGGHGTIFKLAHREDAAELSPGTLLTYRMAEALIEGERLQHLDFGRGDDAYKRDWLKERQTRIGVIAADWRSANGLAAIVAEVIPTRGARAVRKHLHTNRIHSVASAVMSHVVERIGPRLYRSRHSVGNS